jgi:dihydroorotase
LGLPAIPAAAEVIGLYRDLALVELTGVRAHFCRLTTAESVRLIAQAKARGLPVSADVAMHQLHLCDRDLADFDTNCHVDPPLRAQTDRDALRQGLAEGIIDAICSDHRPLGADAKLAPFPRSKPGISALATLVPLLLRLVDAGCLTLATAIASLTQRPATLLGLQPNILSPGAPANLCVIDPQASWRLERETLHGSGLNTPFLNQELRGRVVLTLRAGRIVHELISPDSA